MGIITVLISWAWLEDQMNSNSTEERAWPSKCLPGLWKNWMGFCWESLGCAAPRRVNAHKMALAIVISGGPGSFAISPVGRMVAEIPGERGGGPVAEQIRGRLWSQT